MSLDELMPILIPLIFGLFLLFERVRPARPLPKVKGWVTKGVIFFFMAGAMNGALPPILLSAIGPHVLFDLTGLGTLGGALIFLLVSDLIGYWVHRGLHSSKLVWRYTHQLHHSAERMDMLGASFFHPLDFFLQNVVPPVGLMVLLGISPAAGALGGLLGFVIGVLPHLNMRTPRFLGYVIQRPEMHAVHHLRDVHAYNYGGLAFSDLLFGTWRNPEAFPEGHYGFWDGASGRVGAMLIGRDVTQPPA